MSIEKNGQCYRAIGNVKRENKQRMARMAMVSFDVGDDLVDALLFLS